MSAARGVLPPPAQVNGYPVVSAIRESQTENVWTVICKRVEPSYQDRTDVYFTWRVWVDANGKYHHDNRSYELTWTQADRSLIERSGHTYGCQEKRSRFTRDGALCLYLAPEKVREIARMRTQLREWARDRNDVVDDRLTESEDVDDLRQHEDAWRDRVLDNADDLCMWMVRLFAAEADGVFNA